MARFFDQVRSVGDMARLSGREFGDLPAVISDDEVWTHAMVDERSSALAAFLLEHGVSPRDRCAVVMENVPEQIAVYYGLAKAGIVETAVNVKLAVPEVAYQMHHFGARAVVVSPSLCPLVLQALVTCPGIERVFVVPTGDEHVDPAAFDVPQRVTVEVAPLSRLKGTDPGVIVDPEDWHIVWYTSGTTGRPKGAVHTHRSSTLATAAWIDTWQLVPEDRGVAGNLFHVGCQAAVFGFLAAGGSVVMLTNAFSIESVIEEVEQKRITFFPGIQVMYALLQMRPELLANRDLSSVRMTGYGSSPTDPELVASMMELLPPIGWYHLYGQSECNTGGTCLLPDDHKTKLGSIGKPIPCVDAVSIRDDEDREVPTGQNGELCLQGPTVMVGYLNDPDATAETIKDGWLHTGDVGYMDEDGFIFLVDRKRDVIIRGGENVYPAEVEEVLRRHPNVTEVAVVATPDRVMGESPVAFVAARPGAEVDEAELRQLADANLARYKRPVRYEIVDALPRSAMGKVLKYELRERAEVFAR